MSNLIPVDNIGSCESGGFFYGGKHLDIELFDLRSMCYITRVNVFVFL